MPSLVSIDFGSQGGILHYVVKIAFLVKIMRSRLAKSVVEWFRAVGVRTGAYRVAGVEQIPNATSGRTRTACDLAVELVPTAGGRAIRLLVEAKERVSPLLAIGILQRMAQSPAKGVPTLCSPIISERVADLCRSHGVNYLDEAGNCRLSAPGFFLQVEGRKPVRRATPSRPDPFAIKSSRIARLLLGNPKRDWQVQELADEAHVSLGLAAKVKRALLEQAFVEEQNRRVRLRDPTALLDAWASKYKLSQERVTLYVMEKTAKVEGKIARWCGDHAVRFAVSDLAGAWRLSPAVQYHMSTIYVEPGGCGDVVNGLVEHLEAKRVDSGANLVLVVPDDAFVLYQSRKVEGIEVVSPVQLYLDLHKQPGRSAEVAQEILQREIMPTW
jgi:hypothetical protein